MKRNNRTLQLDKVNAKWLGVCAGVANFLDVEPWTIRMIFLGCMIFGGWFLVPMYFIAWYLLDDKSSDLHSTIMDNQTVKHFRSVDYRKKLYRNTQDGKVWGVCAGIADYLEISAFTVRMVFLLLAFLTVFPVFFYIGATFVLEKKPIEEYRFEARSRSRTTQSGQDAEYNTGSSGQRQRSGASGSNRGAARDSRVDPQSRQEESYSEQRDHFSQRREFQYCARKFAMLQQRLARLEAFVTSNRFKLQREFRNMT